MVKSFRTSYLIVAISFCFSTSGFAIELDSNSVDAKFSNILAIDSSAIHAVMYNRLEGIFTPVLHSYNLGGIPLLLTPNFNLQNWLDEGLFLQYNQLTPLRYSNQAKSTANYTYGLNDSHSLYVDYADSFYKTNINAQFRRFSSLGLFPNSDSKGLNFLLNFDRKGSKWRSNYGYYRNSYTIAEPGRLSDLSEYKSVEEVSVYTISTDLATAENQYINQGGYINNLFVLNGNTNDTLEGDTLLSFKHPKFLHGLGLDLGLNKSDYLFSMDQADVDSNYFGSSYINNTATWDSLGFYNYSYTLNYKLLDSAYKNIFVLGYIGNQYSASVLNKSELWSEFNSYKVGHLNLSAKYVLSGIWQGGYTINLTEKFKVGNKLLGELNFLHDQNLPGYFFQQYQSNHYSWSNNFNKVQQNQLKFKLLFSKLKTGIEGQVNYLNNWVYLDSLSIPKQLSSGFLYSNIGVNSAVQTKFIRFYTKIQYQYANSDVVRFPDFVFRNSLDYFFRIGKIKFTLGYIFTYFTTYEGMAYNPALRRTYLQNGTQVGGFPLLDAFAAFKVGGAQIFVKWENVLFDSVSREYYLYPSSPIAPRFLRFGFNWNFVE